MLPAVHTAQVVLSLMAARMVARKLGQLATPGARADHDTTANRMLTALEQNDRDTLEALAQTAGSDYRHELIEAALEAIDGDGDVGSFIHTASLDARHRAIAGVRVIRGFATLAGALGLLGAMTHHFWLLHADHGPTVAALAAAEASANTGALVSMVIGLGTALLLFLSSRVIRGRVIARLAEIARFADQLEAAATRREQWTREPRG